MENLQARFEAALSKFNASHFEALGEIEKILVTIWGMEAEVNNGGFTQYYFNGAGDQAFFAPVALATIGAHRMAAIASQANAVFGPAGPPRSRSERQSRLAQITATEENVWSACDRAFQDYPDNLQLLLEEFLHMRSKAE
jgi:hypothetical protein